MQRTIASLLTVPFFFAELPAGELPRLPEELDPTKQTFAAQKKLPDLPEPYVGVAPEDLGDGLKVGRLDVPGAAAAVAAFVAADAAGEYANLDSLLLWHDGKLLFEYYNRRGRVNGPHYAMSITKTLTSVTLGRAMQLGLLSMGDLDKPVIDFMPEIDRTTIKTGVDTITLRDALLMQSGLRWEEKRLDFKLGQKHKRQACFQKLFEQTAPVTPESKAYKYIGSDPSMIMLIIDIKAPGTAEEFIDRELAGRVGATYCWENQPCGLPKCGAGSNWTSRDLVKFGSIIIQGGTWQGEQLLHPEYVRLILDTSKGDGYFYYFHNRDKMGKDGKIDFISGVGAGGHYMSMFPDLNIVMVATSHNKGQIGLPLDAALKHLIPLFVK